MHEKIKVHWVTPVHNFVGNALGYNQHNQAMKKHCSEIMDLDENAEIALQISPADMFRYVAGKINVLFTMWEFLEVPNKYIGNLNRADVIVVPSTFCKQLFRKYTDRPIYVCHEGIEPGEFPFHQRTFPPNGKFRFLWVGAPNPRKGYPMILESIKMIENVPHLEMYVKTTAPKMDKPEFLKKLWKERKTLRKNADGRKQFSEMFARRNNPDVSNKFEIMGPHKNIFFDTRRLSYEDLCDLYNSAHCFVLPTLGEGWGLTLCEAMATGCPSIATNVTGVTDYFDEDVGYPIKHTTFKQQLNNYDDLNTEGYVPYVNDMVEKMGQVYNGYTKALAKGKRASDRIHGKFTWDKAAHRLDDILREVMVGKVDQAKELVHA